MKKKYFLLIAGILLVAIITFFYIFFTSSEFREKIISTIFKPHKSLVNVKPDYVFKATDFYNIYELNEKKSDSLYIDRIIQVSGPVAEIIQEKEEKSTIILRDDIALSGINCSMDEEFTNVITEFKSGDTIIIKGVCAGMLMDVILTRCVMVK